MNIAARRRRIMREACTGCQQNRYNRGRGYQETPNDAPVTCDHCWHIDSIPEYNRRTKRFICKGNYRNYRLAKEDTDASTE